MENKNVSLFEDSLKNDSYTTTTTAAIPTKSIFTKGLKYTKLFLSLWKFTKEIFIIYLFYKAIF